MKNKKIIYAIGFLILFFLILFAISYGVFRLQISAPCQNNCSTKIFVVPQGATTSQVFEKLEKEKIIRSAFFAKLYLKITNFNGQIQAGDFRINTCLDFPNLLALLQKGTIDFWVTIPEGWRAEQIYEKILSNTNKSKKNARDVEIYRKNEGYLFPDTYLIPRNASDENIISIMRNNFYNKIQMVTKFDCRNVACYVPTTGNATEKISLSDLIILASLVEREAKNDDERPIIANIIYKRWIADWPLQVDATVQYAIGKPDEWWKKELLLTDLAVDNPYNTYKNQGLPPTPICNPGLKAIEVVINQEQTPYWFYATGKDGVTRYCVDLNCHNLNVEENVNK